MTLFKQISLILSLFLVVVLMTVMWLNFKTANDFVQNQLYTDAQDTATSLGLSLSSVADFSDLSTVETMMNAVFDRGYFEVIELNDMDGKELLSMRNEIIIKNVPSWFVNIIELEAPSASVLISDGWIPFGELTVKSNPGHAYIQLWNTLKSIAQSFFILGVVVFIGFYLLLTLILRTLKEVEKQASAVEKNEFIILDKKPFTTEFRIVVAAMNKMVKRVQEIFYQEAETLKKYHELLYIDNVTKLYNRRFFMQKLGEYLGREDALSGGSLVLFSLDGLEDLKKALGYQKLDDAFRSFADTFRALSDNAPESEVARLSGTDFAILLPTYEAEDAQQISQDAMDLIKSYIYSLNLEDVVVNFSSSVTAYCAEDTLKTLLSKADFALVSAKTRGNFAVILYQERGDGKSLILGKEQWSDYIMTSMSEDRIKMAFQGVKDDLNKDTLNHKEIYLRLVDPSGEVFTAGYFMPMLMTLGLTNDVDKHLFNLAFDYAKTFETETSLALNVSTDFIVDRGNINWLDERLKALEKTCSTKLIFEVSDRIAQHSLDDLILFAQMVKSHGHNLGLDNFSAASDKLLYLEKLTPLYIKADQAFLLDMIGENQSNSLSIITKSLGTTLIATAVESKEQYEKLQNIGVTMFQGRYISEIEIYGL
jgi:diguanylate cyclase (GGDEF)-like protein